MREKLWIEFLTGDIGVDELVDRAAEAVDPGEESEALRRLVSGDVRSHEEANYLISSLLGEADDQHVVGAVRDYVKDAADRIIRGSVAPHLGARKIWRAALLLPGNHEYDAFIYAASEYEDRPADQSFFENAIMDEAKRVLRSASSSPPPES